MQKPVDSSVSEVKHWTIMQKSWFFIVTVVVLLDSSYGGPCRYWCKVHEDHYYCCPSGHPEHSKSEEKWASANFWAHIIGFLVDCTSHKHKEHHASWSLEPETPKSRCPPARSVCPRSWNFDPPKLCDSDKACGPWEKCCYDICLDHKACKPAE
ncbi:uncharacterized protein LOC107038232 [Diachasma alloeum]|uniref:uncharacterized protein LOC107038232 n=1 Tax=Diachasma alloeum TaxID=454923 RepID=UPI00073812A8|nr:uncharacterized protein LOC107038232 [Diachasma alloeum]